MKNIIILLLVVALASFFVPSPKDAEWTRQCLTSPNFFWHNGTGQLYAGLNYWLAIPVLADNVHCF